MKPSATKTHIDRVVERIKTLGLKGHIIVGAERTVVAVVGTKREPGTRENLASIDGVEKVVPIMNALEQALSAIPRFSIIGRGIGVFPDIRRARVLWAGLEGKPLGPLAVEVETALEPIGFAREKRAFRPHLTIGRWRNFDGQSERLKQEIECWKDCDFGESWVEEVVFFQSVLKPQGAVYSPLKVITLGGRPPPN
ncbi:MAG: RNA 2',3'-cyclic phosphodiesterase, partial [Deltaproteobacteria bacterium]|nr:RNA 2',3'-cyclic phosphodiesterase [Deltaproteobacteria bacterium]